MRIIVLVLAISIALMLGSGVATADDDIGCGVGTMIWDGQKGLAPKIMGSLTNFITFQSISITFGLLNCNGQNTVTADARQKRLNHFASVYFDRLAEEMAIGGGEHLDALAALLDVPVEERQAFAILTQQNFDKLYSHEYVTVGEMLTSLTRLMADDPQSIASAG